MRKDIINFFRPFCKRYNLSLTFIPDGRQDREVYILHYKGRSVLSLNTRQFFQMPKTARINDIMGRLKRGLTPALEDPKTREQIYMPFHQGKILIK